MSFEIAIDRRDATTAVVAVQGDFDLRSAGDVRNALVQLVEDGARRLVVDLTETTFLDSTALGALVSALKRARANDGDIELACTDRSIVRVFQITGLDRVFRLHDTLAAAFAPSLSPA